MTSKLLEQDSSAEKLYSLNDNIGVAVAGMTADAGILINSARVIAQNYLKNYNEDIPVELLVRRLCDIKQGYTQHGGLRPFGVSFLFAGYDERYGFQLYTSNPSGNYSGWKATSIGANNNAAQTLLKQDYKNEITLEQAQELALKVLSKTMDAASLSSEKIEFSTISKRSEDAPVVQRLWKPAEIDALLTSTGIKKNEDEEEQEQE